MLSISRTPYSSGSNSRPGARILRIAMVIAAAAGLACGQPFPPALPPAPGAEARDAGAAQVKERFSIMADACTVALDGDGKVVGLEMAGAGKVLAVSARKARTMTAKKWQQVARDFLGATPGPTAILMAGPYMANYVFFVKAVTFSKRRGEGKVLAFETQQTRSQARQNGPGLGDSSSTVALGACSLGIDDPGPGTTPTPGACPLGQADFRDGCVAVCPPGQVDAGSGCAPPATGACTDGTCIARDPCTYADTVCTTGSICPGATLVSAECADRSVFDESPCVCMALKQLAALSSDLQAEAPWNALANRAYCQTGSLNVTCATVDGVKLPTSVKGDWETSPGTGLTGALPSSLGDLGPSLTFLELYSQAITAVPTEIGALTGLEELDLTYNAIAMLPTDIGALTGLTFLRQNYNALTALPTEIGTLTGLTTLQLGYNAISSLPSEIGALTGLRVLFLDNNQLTGVPAEFRAIDPSEECSLYSNPGFSCANVGAGTSCCTGDDDYGNPGYYGNHCGEGLSGGPCYAN